LNALMDGASLMDSGMEFQMVGDEWQKAGSPIVRLVIPGSCQNPLHQFPRSKSITSLWQVGMGKVRYVCCVVSFPEFHYNDLLTTCYWLVSNMANYVDMSR